MLRTMKYMILWGLCIAIPVSPFFALAGNTNPIYSSDDLIAEDVGTLSVQPYVSLPGITAAELLGGMSGTAVNLGRWTRGMHNVNAYMPITPYLVRDLPSLWSMRISSKDSPGNLIVRYELIGANGRLNCLSNTEHPDSEIQVTFYPMGSVIVSKGKKSNLVSGGVTMYLKTDKMHDAGKYSGTLVVITDNL